MVRTWSHLLFLIKTLCKIKYLHHTTCICTFNQKMQSFYFCYVGFTWHCLFWNNGRTENDVVAMQGHYVVLWDLCCAFSETIVFPISMETLNTPTSFQKAESQNMTEVVNGAQQQLFCWEQIISLPLEGSVLSTYGLLCLSVNKLKCNSRLYEWQFGHICSR